VVGYEKREASELFDRQYHPESTPFAGGRQNVKSSTMLAHDLVCHKKATNHLIKEVLMFTLPH